MRGLIILGILAVLAGVPAAALFYGQRTVEAELIAAITSSNVDGVASRVDFDKLRAFLKQDLQNKKNDTSPIGALYASAGPAKGNIDKVVDYYVQPENIGILYYFRTSSGFDEIPVEKFIVGRGYSPLYGFYMTFGLPPEALNDAAARANAARFQVRVVFRLSGLTWKVAELHAPLYMVPKFTYSQPALQVFAPQKR